ncbi:MAG: hypothetical protein LLG04_10470 [Parachlamydia sp.]|nr:hypothetical protein [Parachlamydia sp.]
MQPAVITGRDIIYRTQGQQAWQNAVQDYHLAVKRARYCLNEMKTPSSNWWYHHVRHVFVEFPEGNFDKGFKNPFPGCKTEAAIQCEEMVITAQVAVQRLEELVQILINDRVMKQDEKNAVLKFLRKKAKHPKHGEILEFYPERLKKFFSKIETETFKSPEHKATYRLLKDDIDRKLGEMNAVGTVVIDAFLEQLKDKQQIDLIQLKEEVIWGSENIANVTKLLSWVDDVTQLKKYTPALEREAIIQLILNPKKYPGMVDLLNYLHQSKAFAKCKELKKFFAAWGQLLVEVSPSFNRIHAIEEEYRIRKQELDRQTGCVSLEMQIAPPITLELCNAFLILGGKAPIDALPKRVIEGS